MKDTTAEEVARGLGLAPAATGLVAWDVFDAVLTPGDVILLLSWRDEAAARDFQRQLRLPDGARLRRVRVVRDYGMFDRREARSSIRTRSVRDDPFLIERGLAYRHDPAACEAFEAQGGGCRLDSRP